MLQMGSTIEVPLYLDKHTEEAKCTTYMRICVEIDGGCKYPKTIPVVVLDKQKAYLLPVEYQGANNVVYSGMWMRLA